MFLALVSCSPKHGNKNEEKVTVFSEEIYVSESEYIGMIIGRKLPDVKLEKLEKGSKVIFKGFAGEHPYYSDISLVAYNGVDVYVETRDLLHMEVTMVQDDKIIEFDYNYYFNKDKIKVYKECNKKSESFFVTKEELKFHRIKGIKDWLYLSADYLEDDNFGFVYVYDISEKSFYGNFYKNRKSRNSYRMALNSEYKARKHHKNIKRYGPLLTIHRNHKTFEFWDAFVSADYQTIKYSLLDYYPKYNEVLIDKHFFEGGYEFIYNLESGDKYDTGIPYFNSSRTYMISSYVPWVVSSLKIYTVNNGLYTLLKEIKLYDDDDNDLDDYVRNYIYIKDVVWLNDNNAQIKFWDSSSMLVEIGEEIKITREPKKQNAYSPITQRFLSTLSNRFYLFSHNKYIYYLRKIIREIKKIK
jgi:hypothetical protein